MINNYEELVEKVKEIKGLYLGKVCDNAFIIEKHNVDMFNKNNLSFILIDIEYIFINLDDYIRVDMSIINAEDEEDMSRVMNLIKNISYQECYDLIKKL